MLGPIALIGVLSPVRASAQVPIATDAAYVTIAPGAHYAASGFHQRLFGSGYRELWTTPIRVPVIDLSTLGGGVTPVRVGGGMTTRTLHLMGADGRRYVFRSVDKSPVAFEDFDSSLLRDLLQDQVSSFHPTGATVAARLLDAVGVLHPIPRYMVVPDDPRLGEFRAEFAGDLVLVEERPDDGPDGAPGFAGAGRIASTAQLFDALESNADHRVDAVELLKARLVDLIVGDRDRSHNNHLWARFRTNEGTVWRVVPRDRDQAFVRFDGFFKALARNYDRRLVSFHEGYSDIFGLTRNAWDIDRRLLVALSRDSWFATVREVQGALTDEVIVDAVRTMPPEHAAVAGEEMTEALMRRRDRLDRAAATFYRIVFSVPDIALTDEPEHLTVTRGEGQVTVEARVGGSDGPVTFRRVFTASETTEIRIYLRGGQDQVVLRGGGADGVVVRIMGGGGRDSFTDESWRGQPQTILYDAGDQTQFPTSGAAKVVRRSPTQPFSWFELDRDLDWGSLTVPRPTASYDADRGLMIAPGLRHDRFHFDKRPFGGRFQLQAGWAFGLEKPVFDGSYLARDVIADADLSVRFRWSGMEIINFYGLGNETSTTRPVSYHRVAHKQVTATVAAGIGDGERRYVDFGPTFTYTSTDTTTADSFVSEVDPYGSGQFAQAGVQLSFALDTRDHVGAPTSGFRIAGGASAYPHFLDAAGSFEEVHAEASTYLSPAGGNPVLALRVAGKRVWGTVPFSEAAFVGGPSSVRSIREQRYAGDAMALGNAELRVKIGRMSFLVPADIGVLALADAGRVFLDGESSTAWHTAVGGGVWFALLNRSNVVQLTLSRGQGRTALNAGVGFVF